MTDSGSVPTSTGPSDRRHIFRLETLEPWHCIGRSAEPCSEADAALGAIVRTWRSLVAAANENRAVAIARFVSPGGASTATVRHLQMCYSWSSWHWQLSFRQLFLSEPSPQVGLLSWKPSAYSAPGYGPLQHPVVPPLQGLRTVSAHTAPQTATSKSPCSIWECTGLPQTPRHS